VLAAGVIGAWWLTGRKPEARPAPVASPRAPAASRPRPTPLPSSLATPRPEAPTAGSARLTVESDVPGASVFLDRTFLGKTPLEIARLEPGTHRLHVSAEGHETFVQEVDEASAPRRIVARFLVVELDASVPVVHKHGVGSCRGELSAAPYGLRYAAPGSDHTFTTPLSALVTFEVDYLQKNLRLKLKNGKTYNFTHPSGAADPLFVFHRDVEKARARLAAGG
jgi:hypothetical protein